MYELFPLKIGLLQANSSVIQRCYGSFYDVRLPPASVDAVLMSQAFHHANKPLDLIDECKHLMRPGGVVVLCGEHEVALGRC